MHAEITTRALCILKLAMPRLSFAEPPQRGPSTGHAKSRPVESPYDLRRSPRRPSPVERLEYPRENAKKLPRVSKVTLQQPGQV